VRVKNVYSGHGTYSTCGLAHWHQGVRLRIRDEWMKPQADTARSLEAGFGFFAHAFQQADLQSPEAYRARLETLCDDLAVLAAYARDIGLSYIGLEQMYTPHMPPWTIAGTEALMADVLKRAGAPMYITLDLGHMNGQQYFLKPSESSLRRAIGDPALPMPWVGTERANLLLHRARRGELGADDAVQAILSDVEANPQLFCKPCDGDLWGWIRALGQYAPIVHLQQTDGKSSPHWPFSERYNRMGIASGEALLDSLAHAFVQPAQPGMPAPVNEVVLTLEPFVGTAANPYAAVDDIAQSVAYWRGFLPRDGMRLSEVLALRSSRA